MHKIYFNFRWALLLLACFSFQFSFAQEDEWEEIVEEDEPVEGIPSEFQKFPMTKATKVATINLADTYEDWSVNLVRRRAVHEPGLNMKKDAFKKLKDEANQKRHEDHGEKPGFGLTGKRMSEAPKKGASFFGNYYELTPNDNTIAVNRDGIVFSANNSKVYIFDKKGKRLAVRGFDAWYESDELLYDPKVTYDPDENRFVFIFLNGTSPWNSKIITCVSKTDDPMGDWYVYEVVGNPQPEKFGNAWTDFPNVGLSTKDIFLACNLYSEFDWHMGSYLYQLDKRAAYQGLASVNIQGWGGSDDRYFAMNPAQGVSKLYGPHFYLVSTLPAPMGEDNKVFIHHITNSVGKEDTKIETHVYESNISYMIPPDAEQKGTFAKLDTRNTIVRGCYYENKRIHFAGNEDHWGKPGIYYGVVKGLDNLGTASVHAQHITADSMEMGFPALTWGGKVDANGNNSSLLFFNFASEKYYPGNAIIYVATDGAYSKPTICVEGDTYVKLYGGYSTQRWGDYSGISMNPDNPGEAWVAGYQGYGENYNGTWISRVYAPGTKRDPSETSSFGLTDMAVKNPDPNTGIERIYFDVPKSAMYEVVLEDDKGKQLRVLIHDRVKAGEGMVTFNKDRLDKGNYVVVIRDAEAKVVHKYDVEVTE